MSSRAMSCLSIPFRERIFTRIPPNTHLSQWVLCQHTMSVSVNIIYQGDNLTLQVHYSSRTLVLIDDRAGASLAVTCVSNGGVLVQMTRWASLLMRIMNKDILSADVYDKLTTVE